MKVLQIFHGLGTGGAETWLLALLRHWRAQAEAGGLQVETDVLLTGGESVAYDDEAASLGARLLYCRSTRANMPPFLRFLRRTYREGDYNAVHSHGDYLAGWHFALGIGLLPSVRVAHVHNPRLHITANYAVNPSRRVSSWVGKSLVETLATHVCGTSAESLREYGFELGGSRRPAVSVVHCGFAINRFNADREPDRASLREEFGWPTDVKVILFAGRLDRHMEFDHAQNHKNSWFALHAAKAAASRDETVRLLMAGAGDEMRAQLESVIAEWGLSNRLRLVGVRHDMPRLMRGSDVLLFPSRQEGLGMVAVEAQAASLPVLASTAVPRECVVLSELCEFLPLAEGPSAWGEALLRAMERPHLPMMRCRKAFVGSPFSIEESAASLERIYRGES